jgi:hypothetical protein
MLWCTYVRRYLGTRNIYGNDSRGHLYEKTYADSLIDTSLRTHKPVASTGDARLTYITRFMSKKILIGEE